MKTIRQIVLLLAVASCGSGGLSGGGGGGHLGSGGLIGAGGSPPVVTVGAGGSSSGTGGGIQGDGGALGTGGASTRSGGAGGAGGAGGIVPSQGGQTGGRPDGAEAGSVDAACETNALWRAITTRPNPFTSCYPTPDGGVGSDVVLDSEGRVVENTGLSGAERQNWLDNLSSQLWLCLAGRTLHYSCFTAG
ncbi:MAG TPA: hypothetical protein VF550_12460 [Polyangia bacterium]